MISVCLASYNGAKYIKEQVDSILSQISFDDELIISDDGSTDDTLNILYKYNDSRIRIYNHKPSIKLKNNSDNVTHNFEYALSCAKGDIIFLSDQDDIWLPNRVAAMLKCLESNMLVVADCSIVDEKLCILYPSYFDIHRTKKGVINNIYKNAFVGSSMAFRRDVLDIAFPFPLRGVGHDLWLGLIASCIGEVAFIYQPLTLYRRHACTVSPTGSKSNLSILYRLYYRVLIVYELIKRLCSWYIKQ